MAENSSIEWTDHTFNAWMGCTKVHEGCRHCYAEVLMDHRYGKAKWGPSGTRVLTSDANWRKPIQWNKAAQKDGVRKKVFCASLADVFEDRPELIEPRKRLFALIDSTPHLDWQMLTKRPENIRKMWVGAQRENVWLGTSVSMQEHADKQVPELLMCRHLCGGLFLSIEPLLGPINLTIKYPIWPDGYHNMNSLRGYGGWSLPYWKCKIDWVIVGGESGHGARPMHPDWVRSLRDQCVSAGVPFFFKQWGEWAPAKFEQSSEGINKTGGKYHLIFDSECNSPLRKIGKKAAGNLLDGEQWMQFPKQE